MPDRTCLCAALGDADLVHAHIYTARVCPVGCTFFFDYAARLSLRTLVSWECGTASGRKKSDLVANQGCPASHASSYAVSWCRRDSSIVTLTFFSKARSIRGNITIEPTTTTEMASRIRNVATVRSPSISCRLMCQRRSIGVAKTAAPVWSEDAHYSPLREQCERNERQPMRTMQRAPYRDRPLRRAGVGD